MTKEELKNLKKGTIVYYITDRFRKCYADSTAWSVEFGVFDGLSSYRISKDNIMTSQSEGIILPLECKDCRYVKTLTSDWTPFYEFRSETEWHKLPKNWSCDTELFWVENRYPQGDYFNFDIRNRKKIKQLYDEGWFVELDKNDHRHIEVEFDHDYYKVVKKSLTYVYSNIHQKPLFYNLPHNRIFLNYDEARKKAKQLYEIEKNISLIAFHNSCMKALEEHLMFISDTDRRAKYRRKILSMGEIEKFILRHVDGKILWSYRNAKPLKWKEIEID